ncbi:unnamed protein product, partial [Closterium sp. NIES-64]
ISFGSLPHSAAAKSLGRACLLSCLSGYHNPPALPSGPLCIALESASIPNGR